MSSFVANVTFDCRDAEAVAHFWEAVTDYGIEFVPDPGNPYWVLSPPDTEFPRLVFVTVPEEKSTKNRVHLDIVARDRNQEEEVARLTELGARLLEDRRLVEPGGWVVMTDPEGNEFCVEG
jgi:predicted enzyme related to lactoylglutathione lyase